MKTVVPLFLLCFLFASCSVQKKISLTQQSKLKFINEYIIPHGKVFQNTVVGGLSGIDYDAKNNLYYLISDDRSERGPARFYTAKIHLNEKGIDSVAFVSVKNLLRPDGQPYPDLRIAPAQAVDPEAIRYHPKKKELIWSSEGERRMPNDVAALLNPAVYLMSTDGKFIDSFVLPPNMHMQASEKGPRQNGVFEGLSFTDNYKKVLVSVEEPLYEDGSRADVNDSAWVRIICFDAKSGKPEKQYAYRIDPVAYPPNPTDAFKVNGISEILAVNDQQVLVMERSFSEGRKPATIKIYLAELKNAQDVSSWSSLNNARFVPVTKSLLLNMDALGSHTDNIEGVTFGPVLPNGHRTLVFVSDNNFSEGQVTQLLLFEIH